MYGSGNRSGCRSSIRVRQASASRCIKCSVSRLKLVQAITSCRRRSASTTVSRVPCRVQRQTKPVSRSIFGWTRDCTKRRLVEFFAHIRSKRRAVECPHSFATPAGQRECDRMPISRSSPRSKCARHRSAGHPDRGAENRSPASSPTSSIPSCSAIFASRRLRGRNKLALRPRPRGYHFCLVVSAQYRESFGMSSHKGTLRP